jgi:hypothetical protein
VGIHGDGDGEVIHWTRLFEQLESEGLKPVFVSNRLLMGSAMRAARKEANPGLAFVVPARTKRRGGERTAHTRKCVF